MRGVRVAFACPDRATYGEGNLNRINHTGTWRNRGCWFRKLIGHFDSPKMLDEQKDSLDAASCDDWLPADGVWCELLSDEVGLMTSGLLNMIGGSIP